MLYKALAVGVVIGYAVLFYMQERKIKQQRALLLKQQKFIEETLARCEEAVQAMENVEKPVIVYVNGPSKNVQN